jgi:hypothetical protein
MPAAGSKSKRVAMPPASSREKALMNEIKKLQAKVKKAK